MGIATFCVLMVSLLLVGVSSLFVMNIEILLGSIENKNELVLFLKDSVTEEMLPDAQKQISALPNIASVKYYPKEEALENYIAQMKEYEEVFDSIRDDNPLPNAFNISIADTSKMTDTVKALNAFDFTEKVKAPTEFAQILTRLRKVVFITSIALLTALIIVSLIMISNSTRASVYARRREINIMKYVGATNSFIRMPFFFEGLFTGFVSGVLCGNILRLYNSDGYNHKQHCVLGDHRCFRTSSVQPDQVYDACYLSLYRCCHRCSGKCNQYY